MIQHPAVLALQTASLAVSGMLLGAGWQGSRILAHWDLTSGSELQLQLERRTYLISTLLAWALAFQIGSLFFFIYTADDLHTLFSGAMCAAGTLNGNGYGYPALLLKVVNCIAAGGWLILNHTDTRGYDYPLIRPKYRLLNLLALLVAGEALLQFRYFLLLKGDLITSCCGSLFSAENAGLAGGLAGLPHTLMQPLLFGSMAAVLLCGWLFFRRGSGYLFALVALVTFLVAVASLISFLCLYFYQLPTHHCPFCLLQREYGYVGYPLYATLLGGVVSGLGVGLLMPFRRRSSLAAVIPRLQRRLVTLTMVLYLLFALVAVWPMLTGGFRLG